MYKKYAIHFVYEVDKMYCLVYQFQPPSRQYHLEKVYDIHYNNVSQIQTKIISPFPNIDIDLFVKRFNKKNNTNLKRWRDL